MPMPPPNIYYVLYKYKYKCQTQNNSADEIPFRQSRAFVFNIVTVVVTVQSKIAKAICPKAYGMKNDSISVRFSVNIKMISHFLPITNTIDVFISITHAFSWIFYVGKYDFYRDSYHVSNDIPIYSTDGQMRASKLT